MKVNKVISNDFDSKRFAQNVTFYLDQNTASSFIICILKEEHGDNAKKKLSRGGI